MNIVIAAGGTAGHINPGITIANTIKKHCPDANITFIGTEYGLEKKLVTNAGYNIRYIHSKSLSKNFIKFVKSVFSNTQGVFEAKKILKELNPKIVIGMGGYVCAPVLFAAKKILNIPVFIHESNAIVGKTNKFIGKFADGIAVGFENTKEEFHNKFVFVTGNPVNENFLTAKKVKSEEKNVVVFGGSQGAKGINDVIINLINNIKNIPYKITYATGEKQYENVIKSLTQYDKNKVTILPYIYNMPELLSTASLVVSRAGALTISELRVMDVPAVLIPLPTAAENHQEYNAKAFEEEGRGKMILEKNLTYKVLDKTIRKMLSTEYKGKENNENNASEVFYNLIKKYLI